MNYKKDKRSETLIYLALWAMLFITPVMSLYIRTANNSNLTFDWSEVMMVWRQYGLFFIIFLIHNHLLAPLLVYRQKRLLYCSVIGVLITGFVIYQCSSKPDMPKDKGPFGPRQEMAGHHGPPPPPKGFDGKEPTDDDFMPPQFQKGLDGEKREPKGFKPDEEFKPGNRFKPDGARPLMSFYGQREIVALVILLLMLGANLGIKLFFKQRGDQKRLADLEKQNLEQQLEYLKYQINPHFLMNTLNNIHALVDIDPELAKNTILELSKMMRFMLYEGNKPTVPLSRELDFLDHYITLMRLRYTDRVSITVHKPDELPNCEIPPLIFITFVENAFKHGVSYQQDSFIEISIEICHSTLRFSCRNSRIPAEEDKHDGLGLSNVKQRLELIYGKNYTLDIKDKPEEYNIQLELPLLGI